MNDENNKTVLQEIINLIEKGNAHASFEEAVANLNPKQLTVTPEFLPYNIWQLAEHIRIAQWDIVEFCINPNHKSPKWPDEYWVEGKGPVTDEEWKKSLSQIEKDKERLLEILRDPSTNIYEPLAHGTGQNILREALLIADHNAYHIGEIIIIRRLLQIWN